MKSKEKIEKIRDTNRRLFRKGIIKEETFIKRAVKFWKIAF